MKPVKITNNKPKHEPNRIGDMAEHYAITWLWDNGDHVFKNCGFSKTACMTARPSFLTCWLSSSKINTGCEGRVCASSRCTLP